jgi:DNA replication protein DnaC
LKLLQIAQSYREVLDEAARKGSSPLEVLRTLIGLEAAARQQRALARRIREARLPPLKTMADYDFIYPKRIPKEALVRLFDCAFVGRHGCGVLIGPTGTGKTHLLTALAYVACEKGYSVRYTRVVDMLNHLTAAQINGTLGKVLGAYVRPSLLLLDELSHERQRFRLARAPDRSGATRRRRRASLGKLPSPCAAGMPSPPLSELAFGQPAPTSRSKPALFSRSVPIDDTLSHR